MKHHHQTHRRPLRSDTRGAIYVEFLIAFIPFFVMVLGMMQIALMYSARLIVQHAAATSVRSAMVVFADCEYRYGGAPQNVVNGGGRGDDPISALTGLFGAGGVPGGLFPSGGSGSGGARLDAVRFAANLPLTATAPSIEQLRNGGNPRSQSLVDAIGGQTSPAARLALGALGYNNIALSVTFPRTPGVRNSFRDRFNNRDELTARVTYLFHCGVPIVNRMACDDAIQLFTGVPLRQMSELRETMARFNAGRSSFQELQTVIERVGIAQGRLQAARPGLEELGTGSIVALGAAGGNYSVLRAEATLPLQGTQTARIASPCFRSN